MGATAFAPFAMVATAGVALTCAARTPEGRGGRLGLHTNHMPPRGENDMDATLGMLRAYHVATHPNEVNLAWPQRLAKARLARLALQERRPNMEFWMLNA